MLPLRRWPHALHLPVQGRDASGRLPCAVTRVQPSRSLQTTVRKTPTLLRTTFVALAASGLCVTFARDARAQDDPPPPVDPGRVLDDATAPPEPPPPDPGVATDKAPPREETTEVRVIGS